MKKYIAIIASLLAVIVIGLNIHQADAVLTYYQPGAYPVPYFLTYDLFATTTGQTTFATTTTATSTNVTPYFDANGRLDNGQVNIAGAKKVTWYFSLTATSSQSAAATTTFTVQVSPDGTNWYNWNKLTQNVSSTTNQLEVGSVALSNSTTGATASTTSSINSMDMTYDGFNSARCIVSFAAIVDGLAFCRASVTY